MKTKEMTMAFTNKQNLIVEALGTNETEKKIAKKSKKSDIDDASLYETTKPFTFTLQPSVRKKLDELAKAGGYRSASGYLNELIKEL